MLIGVDMNILIALTYKARPDHGSTALTVPYLVRRGHTLTFAAQTMREFWNVSTRPVEQRGGLGLSVDQALAQVGTLESTLRLLLDNEDVYSTWRRLLEKHKVRGVQVHDAYLAASLISNHVSRLLTWNAKDFKRFDSITALTPDEVLAGAL